MGKGCCGGGVVASPTPPAPMAMAIQGGTYKMNGHDYVAVELDDGMLGEHLVKGSVTKTSYGYRVHGERFLIHVNDLPSHTNPQMRSGRVRILPTLDTIVEADIEVDDSVDPEKPDVSPSTQIDKPDLANAGIEMFDGEPTITNLTLTPKQITALEGIGIFTCKELVTASKEKLKAVKGLGEFTVTRALDEAYKLLGEQDEQTI